MDYKVEISKTAMLQFDSYINYIVNVLKNKQAASAVMQDYNRCILLLRKMPKSLRILEDKDLCSEGYRRINFDKHRYFILYRVQNKKVIVDAIYHGLQDYKNMIR